MNSDYKTFGAFLAAKREEKDYTLRELADILKLSAPYLSDIEKDRRNPLDMERLTKLVEVFALDQAETTLMMDLAGKSRNSVAPDLPDYIMSHDYVSAALRTARDLGAGEKEWLEFIEDLKRRKG